MSFSVVNYYSILKFIQLPIIFIKLSIVITLRVLDNPILVFIIVREIVQSSQVSGQVPTKYLQS